MAKRSWPAISSRSSEVLGSARRYRSIPKIALQSIGLFNPLMREIAEMYYLFEGGLVLDDAALRSRIGDWPKTTFREGLRQTIAWMRADAPAQTVAAT